MALGIFIFIYLALTLFIGIRISSRVKNANDFISAGRKLPLIFNTFALFALWFGSETIFGASAEFAEKGFLGVIEDPFGATLCLIIYATVFARVLYRKNFFTLGDLFRNAFGPRIEWISSFFMIISFTGYIAAQLVALGILANLVFNISLASGILISAAIVCIYTLTGGMWAVSVTDFIQSLVIMIGLAWVAWSISGYGNHFMDIIHKAPPGHFSILPKAGFRELMDYLSAWMVIGLGSLPSQDLFQRFNSAKSERSAVLAGFIGAGLYLAFAMLPLFIVLAIRILYPETDLSDAQSVIPAIIILHSSLPVQVMMLGALISAILSTCSGAILAPATLLAENIIKPLSHLNSDPRRFLTILRISVFLMALSGVIMALIKGNIYRLVGESSVLGLVSMLVPMIHALYSRKRSPLGAFISMVAGFSGWLIAEHFIVTEFPPLLTGLIMSVAGLCIGWIIEKKRGKLITSPN